MDSSTFVFFIGHKPRWRLAPAKVLIRRPRAVKAWLVRLLLRWALGDPIHVAIGDGRVVAEITQTGPKFWPMEPWVCAVRHLRLIVCIQGLKTELTRLESAPRPTLASGFKRVVLDLPASSGDDCVSRTITALRQGGLPVPDFVVPCELSDWLTRRFEHEHIHD